MPIGIAKELIHNIPVKVFAIALAAASSRHSAPASVPQIPSSIPLPPLTKAPSDSILVQPAEKLRQIPELDTFEPGRFAALTDLPHNVDGNFTLYPGAFELIAQSFCLRAGGHGPSGSSAYLVALSGSRASYVSSVLTRWHAQPSIAQGDVQSLLWAITKTAERDDWQWRQQTEIEGYERSIQTLEQWMAKNC